MEEKLGELRRMYVLAQEEFDEIEERHKKLQADITKYALLGCNNLVAVAQDQIGQAYIDQIQHFQRRIVEARKVFAGESLPSSIIGTIEGLQRNVLESAKIYASLDSLQREGKLPTRLPKFSLEDLKD